MSLPYSFRRLFSRQPTSPVRRPARRRLRLEALEDRYAPAVFTVNTLADTEDANPGVTSLREAMTAANSQAGDDVINFTVSGTINLTGALPGITSNIDIQGPGARNLRLRRDTGGDYRLFTIWAAANISGLTLSDGRDSYGGAVYNAGATTLRDCILSGNSASDDGGAIQNQGTGGLAVIGCTLSGNSAGWKAGAIRNHGFAYVANSTLSGNSAGHNGGAFDNAGWLIVINSTIVLNRADASDNRPWIGGGGIMGGGGTLHNTIVAGNVSGTGSTPSDLGGGGLFGGSNNLIGDPGSSIGLSHGINGNILGDGAGQLLALSQILDTTLAANSGPTPTHRLVSGSPAINAGANAQVPAVGITDQRGFGFPRINGGTVDVGAFEVQNTANTQPRADGGGPYRVAEGSSVQLTGLGSTDPDQPSSTLLYEWDLDGDGRFAETGAAAGRGDETGSAPTLSAASLDGPQAVIVGLRVSDGAADSGDTVSILIENDLPTIATSGSGSLNEGATYTLTLGTVSDSGSDIVSQYVVHWGDGSSDTYASGGDKTHVYADGPATQTITVDLVDEDGTHIDCANPMGVTVNNVAPTLAINGSNSVNEGATYTLTLGAVTDPGADTVSQYVVHWGDGSSSTYTTADGDKTHVYAGGGVTRAITVDLVDEDGTHTIRAIPLSVYVNAAPLVAVPAAQTAYEDVDKPITGIVVGDAEGGNLTVTLAVNRGTLSLGTTAALTVSGHGSGSVTLFGSITDLNVALAGLVYCGTLNYSGTDTLSLTVSDGSLSTSAGVAITVKSAYQQATDLRAQVTALLDAGVLNGGQANSLIIKLNLKGNGGDADKVRSFLDHVRDFRRDGLLTQAQADALLGPGNVLLLSVTRR